MKWLAVTSLLVLSLIVAPPATVASSDCADGNPTQILEQIPDSPEEFIGCRIQIEGILHSEEGGKDTIYTIRTASGVSLEVWSWAPEGDGPSRYPSKFPEDIKPMSYFIGRRLDITGRLVQERSGKVVLEASLVEVLDERSDQVF